MPIDTLFHFVKLLGNMFFISVKDNNIGLNSNKGIISGDLIFANQFLLTQCSLCYCK